MDHDDPAAADDFDPRDAIDEGYPADVAPPGEPDLVEGPPAHPEPEHGRPAPEGIESPWPVPERPADGAGAPPLVEPVAGAAGAVGEPISLELDTGADLLGDEPPPLDDAPQPPAGFEGGIELDGDLDLEGHEHHHVDPAEAGFDDGDGPIELAPLDDDATATWSVEEGNGWLPTELLAAAGGLLAGTALNAGVLRRLAGAVGARRAAVELEREGIDARVEHGRLSDLAAWVQAAEGPVALAAGGAGADRRVLTLVEVDELEGRAVVEEPGPLGSRFELALGDLERAWADTANEVLVTGPAGSRLRLLPVTLATSSLRSLGGAP